MKAREAEVMKTSGRWLARQGHYSLGSHHCEGGWGTFVRDASACNVYKVQCLRSDGKVEWSVSE